MTSRERTTGAKITLTPLAGKFTTTQYRGIDPVDGEYTGMEYRDLVTDLSAYSKYSSNGYSHIYDTVGRLHRYNTVQHERIVPLGFSFETANLSTQTGFPPLGSEWRSILQSLPGAFFELTPEAFFYRYYYAWPTPSVPGIDWNGLVASVGDSLDGHITTKSNILVTVGEALKTIAMVRKPLKTLKVLAGSKSVIDVLRTSANLHLEFKYGWKQLYRDLLSFSNVYNNVTEHMRYLNDKRGQHRPLSASQVETGLPSSYLYPRSLGELSYSAEWTNYRKTARFSCMSILDEAIALHSRFYWTLRSLGIDKIVEAAWDLVPFSFVVDWFINFDRLTSFSRTQFNSHKVKYLGYSTKEEWFAKSKTSVYGPSFWNGSPGLRQSWEGPEVRVRTLFSRTPGFPPDTTGAGIFSTLSTTNLADGAALILQRI